MATLDIFNDDAFSLSALSGTIVDVPRIPTMLGDMGLFQTSGINTPTTMIERKGMSINLIPTSPRGAPGQTSKRDNRKLIPLAATHVQSQDTVLADQVYGVRAFGSETELEAVQALVRERLERMRAEMDLTLEWHRLGALKGQVLDADGTSVVLDVYDTFGMTQQTVFWNTDSASSSIDPLMLTMDLKRNIRNKLGGRGFRNVRVICSHNFLVKFMTHNKMKEAYKDWQYGAYLRANLAQSANGGAVDFVFDDVVFTVYDYEIGGSPAIGADFGYAFPEGVPGLFRQTFAPADYMETVGTNGLPYYAKQERLPMDRGIHMEGQSNPLTYCSLPETVIKLSTKAS